MSDAKICDECKQLIDQANEEVTHFLDDDGGKFHLYFQVFSNEGDSGPCRLADLHQKCKEGLLAGFVEAKLGTPPPTKTVTFDNFERGVLDRVIKNLDRYGPPESDKRRAASKLAALLNGAVVEPEKAAPSHLREAIEDAIADLREQEDGCRDKDCAHFNDEIRDTLQAVLDSAPEDTRPLPRIAIREVIKRLTRLSDPANANYVSLSTEVRNELRVLQVALDSAPSPTPLVVKDVMEQRDKAFAHVRHLEAMLDSAPEHRNPAVAPKATFETNVAGLELAVEPSINHAVVRKAQADLRSGARSYEWPSRRRSIADDLDAAITSEPPTQAAEELLAAAKAAQGYIERDGAGTETKFAISGALYAAIKAVESEVQG